LLRDDFPRIKFFSFLSALPNNNVLPYLSASEKTRVEPSAPGAPYYKQQAKPTPVASVKTVPSPASSAAPLSSIPASAAGPLQPDARPLLATGPAVAGMIPPRNSTASVEQNGSNGTVGTPRTAAAATTPLPNGRATFSETKLRELPFFPILSTLLRPCALTVKEDTKVCCTLAAFWGIIISV
jgi:hypothetical protein